MAMATWSVSRPEGMEVVGPFRLVYGNNTAGLEAAIVADSSTLNAKSISGASLLHTACQKNYVNIVRKLLELGADGEARNVRGNTPLHYACIYGSLDAALALAEFGVDTYPVNRDGLTPIDLCKDASFRDNLLSAGSEYFVLK